jgi:hypothetical protein
MFSTCVHEAVMASFRWCEKNKRTDVVVPIVGSITGSADSVTIRATRMYDKIRKAEGRERRVGKQCANDDESRHILLRGVQQKYMSSK